MTSNLGPTALALLVILTISHLVSCEVPTAICTATGATCDSTCRKVGFCLKVNDQFEWEQLKDCGAEAYCDAAGPTCSETLTECTILSEDIICGNDTENVRFPHPLDCKKYYNCKGGEGVDELTPELLSCPVNFAYDACTGSCDISIINGNCVTPKPLCHKLGDYGVIEGNNRLFYLCVQGSTENQFIPKMRTCGNHYFEDESKSCGSAVADTCVRPPVVATTPGPPPVSL